MLRNPGRHSCN